MLELLGITAGTRLVVMGATGGVGGYTVQMAASHRARRTYATVRGAVDEARCLGAEEVYDTEAVDVVGALRACHPNGIDAVLDLVERAGRDPPRPAMLKPGGSLVSTLYAADEAWFAERQVTAQNISSITNPLSSPQGLNEVALLSQGTITARVGAAFELDGAGQMLEKLRKGGLRGKAVIRL